MNKEFIPYEQSLELKKLGFYEGCIAHYEKVDGKIKLEVYSYDLDDAICAAPLYQQAFRWFREKHGLMGVVDCFFYNFSYTYNINDIADEIIISRSDPDNDFDTYEEAELACLKKLIEIIERKPEAYS